MEFYEFGDGFGYYALIGASSDDEAIKFYKEAVADIDDEDASPDYLTKEEAKSKLLAIYTDEQKKEEATIEFEECASKDEPYLVLIDGSLVD